MNPGSTGAQAERRSAEHRPLHQVALQIGALARRSVNRTLRQPAQLVPSLVFPLILMAINSAGLGKATEIPGFPTDSYLTFALAIPFIQAGIFSVSNAGSDLARDIETGFLDRLALTPMTGLSLVSGQLAGVLVLGVIQGVIYLVVGLVAGADFEAGLAGVPVLLALALAISFAFGCIGIFAALRLGNGEAVQGLFPVLFVFLFLSSMALPRDLIEQDWFQTVATYNPVSYLIEGIRSLFIDGFDGQALALGFGFSLAIGLAFLAAASATLRTRLTRT
ncbi:MAG: ABC transporter permease [Thermoleophilaceae bacterium]|nr:ABC transporter permease [Thermoleophilaceae bacterium]